MKWKYKVVEWKTRSGDQRELTWLLADLGIDGWELVTIHDGLAYFKRPKSEEG